MSNLVEMHVLPERRLGESPYESSPCFTPGWWGGLSPALNKSMVSLSFSENGLEVARARIYDPANIAAMYDRFDPRLPTVEIYRFETNVTETGQGYGRASVDLIREEWRTSQVVLFSLNEEAFGFWSAMGFTERARLDPQYGHDPFLVAEALTT